MESDPPRLAPGAAKNRQASASARNTTWSAANAPKPCGPGPATSVARVNPSKRSPDNHSPSRSADSPRRIPRFYRNTNPRRTRGPPSPHTASDKALSDPQGLLGQESQGRLDAPPGPVSPWIEGSRLFLRSILSEIPGETPASALRPTRGFRVVACQPARRVATLPPHSLWPLGNTLALSISCSRG